MLGKIIKIEESGYSNNDLTKLWYNITYKGITGKTVTILDAFDSKPDYLMGKIRFTNNKVSWIQVIKEKFMYRYKYHFCAICNANWMDGIIFRGSKIKSKEDYYDVKKEIKRCFNLQEEYNKITIISIEHL